MTRKKKPAPRRKRRLAVVIDRAAWLRGAWETSCFCDDEGKMCCLGFLGLACGFTARELREALTPSELPSADDALEGPGGDDDVDHPAGSGRWPREIARTSWADESLLTHGLMGVNDADAKVVKICVKSYERTFKVPDEAARERIIAELMAEAGVDVTFVGGSR